MTSIIFEVAYKNLNIVVEALKLLDNGNDGRRDELNQAMSLQKKNERSARKNATAATATKCNESR